MYQPILDLIYPRRCPICHEILALKSEKACLTCIEKLSYVKEPRCKKCGKPIDIEEREYCWDCEKKNYHFIKGFSVWVYNDIMKQSISQFKYQSKKEYADFYIKEMVALYKHYIQDLAPDIIVPIPIHRSKYMERGYNQADLIAKGIGRELEIPVVSNLLLRTRKTLPQKQLTDKERLLNLQEAFCINKKVLGQLKKIDKVLLVDDIYTTGSTLEACTNVLINNGIYINYFITVTIGKGF